MEAFEAEFMEEKSKRFQDNYDGTVEILDESKPHTKDATYQPFIDAMSNWDFRFGASPSFSHTIGPARLHKSVDPESAWGTFDVHLDVKKGAVETGVIYSDCL